MDKITADLGQSLRNCAAPGCSSERCAACVAAQDKLDDINRREYDFHRATWDAAKTGWHREE